jgi:hypothetical protein
MTDQAEYNEIVTALHKAALAIDGDQEIKILALLNIATEAAFCVHGPERGREWLIANLEHLIAGAEEAGTGRIAYYGPAAH